MWKILPAIKQTKITTDGTDGMINGTLTGI